MSEVDYYAQCATSRDIVHSEREKAKLRINAHSSNTKT